MLAALSSLSVFTAGFRSDGNHPQDGYLPFIMRVSDRAPQLEYFAIFESQFHYWKRVRGEWTVCSEEEFP
jgi:hypothetical protein